MEDKGQTLLHRIIFEEIFEANCCEQVFFKPFGFLQVLLFIEILVDLNDMIQYLLLGLIDLEFCKYLIALINIQEFASIGISLEKQHH